MGYAWGEGPTILFVHGWTNHSGTWQSYIAQLVDSGYRVVAFDAPAHGQSSGSVLTPVRYMTVINAFIENIGMPHAIVGHSYGAMCAVLSLRNNPNYPQKITYKNFVWDMSTEYPIVGMTLILSKTHYYNNIKGNMINILFKYTFDETEDFIKGFIESSQDSILIWNDNVRRLQCRLDMRMLRLLA